MDGTQIAYRGQNGQTFSEHQDYLGTERLRSNYQGQTAASELTLAFGDGYQQSVSYAWADQDNHQFAGQDYDSESNTTHAQFRQYSATQGRWMSPDPSSGTYNLSNPQSFNRYVYASNNPLRLLDPSGLDAFGPEPCAGYYGPNGCTFDDMPDPDGGSPLGGGGIPGSDPHSQGKCPSCSGAHIPKPVPAHNSMASSICSAMPSARVIGVSQSIGALGSFLGGGELSAGFILAFLHSISRLSDLVHGVVRGR